MRISPNFVISGPNGNVDKKVYWGALACGTTDANNIQVAIAYLLTDYTGDAR
jgi:hypothetical protein